MRRPPSKLMALVDPALERLERRFIGNAIIDAVDREEFNLPIYVSETLALRSKETDVTVRRRWHRGHGCWVLGVYFKGNPMGTLLIEGIDGERAQSIHLPS